MADVLIARNSITGRAGFGINVAAGANRGQTDTIEHVRILDNRLEQDFCCLGIVIQAGSEAPFQTAQFGWARYPDGNVVRDVLVRGNVVSGRLVAPAVGVTVNAGIGAGGRNNRVENVRIEQNVVRSSTRAQGILLWAGNGFPYRNRWATGNRVTGITLAGNEITLGKANPLKLPDLELGGVVLIGGGLFGRDNAVRNVRITGNRISGASVGIKLIGGRGTPSGRNRVSCVRLAGNRIVGARQAVAVLQNVFGASAGSATLGGC